MTKIILVRHGHVEGLSPERFRGRTDMPLTALGRHQAAAAAARIARTWPPAAIYTSPMGRCVETGDAIADQTGAPAQILGQLNDLDYGTWSWKTCDEMRAASPALFGRWFEAPQLMRFPGGESLQDVVARGADAIRLAAEVHSQETVVLVGHDSVNRAMLLQLLDQPLSAYWTLVQSPCAISEVEILGDRVRVLRVNDTAHLEPG